MAGEASTKGHPIRRFTSPHDRVASSCWRSRQTQFQHKLLRRRPWGWHRAPVVLRIRHAVGDRLGDRGKTAIAPQPFAAREIGRERRALGVGTVAAGAGSAVCLAVEDALAERDLRFRGAGRNRQRGYGGLGAGIRMDAFGRQRIRPPPPCRRGGRGRARCRLSRSRREGHTPNTAMRVVGNVEAPSGPIASPEGRYAAWPGSFTAPAKPSAKTTKLPDGLPSASGWNTTL